MVTKQYCLIHGNTLFICKYCDKKFKDYKSNRLAQKNVFCSKECSSLFQRGKSSWNKGILHTEKHKINLKIAKENEKERLWRRKGKLVSCKICNKKTYHNKYRLEKFKNYFCSKKCSGLLITTKRRETARDLGLSGKGKFLSLNHKNKISQTRKEKIKSGEIKFTFPTKDSSIEIKIQNFLKQLGIEFFTHQYMKEIEHGYQCDILIPSMSLVIECDGNYWHKYPIGLERDHIRTKELIEKGFKVLRLWESEIRVMDINQFRKQIR